MNDMEEIIMDIIVNGGDARAKAIEAIRAAREGRFDVAEELMKKADVSLTVAHNSQTGLIQQEVNGNHQTVTLLMVHAQDHIMNAQTVYELATEMIEDAKMRSRK